MEGRSFSGPGFGPGLGERGFNLEIVARCWIFQIEPPKYPVGWSPQETSERPIAAALSSELFELLGPVAALMTYPPPERVRLTFDTLCELSNRLWQPEVDLEDTQEARQWESYFRGQLQFVVRRLEDAETILSDHGWQFDRELGCVKRNPGPSGGRPEEFKNACIKAVWEEVNGWYENDTLDAVIEILRPYFPTDDLDRDRIRGSIRTYTKSGRRYSSGDDLSE